MDDTWQILIGIFLAGAITWTLRAAPFAVLAPLRKSALVGYLGERMPVGIMLILVAYTLRDVDIADLKLIGSTAVALATTVGLHLWRRNIILSVFGGTLVNVLLQSVLASV